MGDTPQPTVPDYREQVVRWLLRRRDKWRRTAHTATGAAAAAASFYGAAYDAAAEGVQNGEPEKRASIDGCQEPDNQRTGPGVQIAEGVVRDLKADLSRWVSYSGPVMPEQHEVEQKIAGAEMVLAALEAAIPGNADHTVDETEQLRARVASMEAEKAQLIADGLWLGGLD